MQLHPQVWWYVTRASGIVAWALLVASVVWGLTLSTKAMGRAVTPAWLLDLHRHLGALAVTFTAIHLGALVADSWVHFGVADLFVPFASAWRPWPVAWGIVAFYLLLAVEATSLARKRLPGRLWRRVHYLSFPLAGFATLHLFTAGADSANEMLRWAVVASGSVLGFLLVARIAGARAARQPRATSNESVIAGTSDVEMNPVRALAKQAPRSSTPARTAPDRRDRAAAIAAARAQLAARPVAIAAAKSSTDTRARAPGEERRVIAAAGVGDEWRGGRA